MRCYICNKVLEDPQYNVYHKSYDPCDTCLRVIEDILTGYGDRPSIEEDEDAILFESLTPDIPLTHDPFSDHDDFT